MTSQDRAPNFREGGRLYLVRCFNCDDVIGRENYIPAVASGQCAWCGWTERAAVSDVDEDEESGLDSH